MREQGRITHWNDAKGYGFITPSAGGERLFVHISAWPHKGQRPAEQDAVSFIRGKDSRGRARAESLRCARAAAVQPRRQTNKTGPVAVTAIALYAAGLIGGIATGRLPLWVLAASVVASVVAYVAYGLDQAAARRRAWRTPERRLHGLALVGGWPGALLAQQHLRHKTAKPGFQRVFWCTVLIHCAMLAWLATPKGAATLRQFITSVVS
ncbi:DUF1294 domain-containing protein [Abyssibacter profundi]|uniref:DUF1294 domain-containing protein n=1 Tax=Abyssibacter profundi TaxID=2182787 RepID=A0A383XQQ4_9GAMM|nr:DUF1294 domain-containing protein [Abyssibacter profundi]PWN54958.1 DUF1294 domain-containing protein [Abyssibacter profundi]